MLLADKVFKMTENNCLIKSYSTALSCRMIQLFLCSSSSSDSKILFVVLSSFPWSLKTFPCTFNKYFLFVFSPPQCFLCAWLLQCCCYLSGCNISWWAGSLQASVTQHCRHTALQMPPCSPLSSQVSTVHWHPLIDDAKGEQIWAPGDRGMTLNLISLGRGDFMWS